ncbi:hypothetical protein PV735_05230 [Streptomyces turgidiscabies]|uniref:Uncharacterized protein n=1 Tax=Streptomyces turgidiscabies (strain Car8) TaxID=698760 RepID=L7F0S0_STRT8|nr:hypothetical protein [Streptomyces turgidiscabies]ELP64170.1 hypothetical protein STRTUCAR8_05600 [Streptomyces turgidiscabies Car8]MDX3492091.1 hypothetical protein [Streptomyces turgidiscabies]
MAVEIHPATARVLENFRFDHLPAHLQAVSRPFHDLAHQLAETLTGPEVTKALDELWAAKNWAVVAASNAALDGAPPAPLAPAVGDVVLVVADPAENNGATTAPAIVTRVWSATTINARVLHDGPGHSWRTSLVYRENLDGIKGMPAVWTRPGRA